jgi:hypothetical protein
MAQAGRRPDRTAEFIEPAVGLMDAAREPEPEQPAEQPNVQALVQTIEKLTAINERLLAERAAPTITWLPLKVAAHRAGIVYEIRTSTLHGIELIATLVR